MPDIAAAAARLADEIEGAVLLPGSEGFAAACELWNGRFSPRPALIVQCRATAEVAAAVQAARELGLGV